MATVVTSEAAVNPAASPTKSNGDGQDYGLSTEALRALARKWGLERQAGKPVEKMGRYSLLNLLVTQAAQAELRAAGGSNGNGALGRLSQAGLEDMIGRIVDVKLRQSATPATQTITIRQPDGEKLKVCGTMHKALPDVLRLVCAGVPVLLVGPAGSGKTHLASQVARALDLPFSFNSLGAGCTESHIIGRVLPDEAGNWTYRPSPFVRAHRDGGVHLFDEIDAADPNLLVLINAALANGHLSVPFADLPPIERAAALESDGGKGLDAGRVRASRSRSEGTKLAVLGVRTSICLPGPRAGPTLAFREPGRPSTVRITEWLRAVRNENTEGRSDNNDSPLYE